MVTKKQWFPIFPSTAFQKHCNKSDQGLFFYIESRNNLWEINDNHLSHKYALWSYRTPRLNEKHLLHFSIAVKSVVNIVQKTQGQAPVGF